MPIFSMKNLLIIFLSIFFAQGEISAMSFSHECSSYSKSSQTFCLAQHFRDKSVCERFLQDEKISDFSSNQNYLYCSALATRNPEFCEQMAQLRLDFKPLRDFWKSDIAAFEVETNQMRLECVASSTKDVRICDLLNNPDSKNLCIREITGNKFFCQKIVDSMKRSICLER